MTSERKDDHVPADAKPVVDISDILALQKRVGGRCSVGHLEDYGLDEMNLEKAKRALALPKTQLSSTAIRIWLRGLGVPVSEEAVRRHRRGVCQCQT